MESEKIRLEMDDMTFKKIDWSAECVWQPELALSVNIHQPHLHIRTLIQWLCFRHRLLSTM